MESRNKFKCSQCPKVLYSQLYLERHLKTKHPAEKLNFICDFDGKTFATKDLLRIHLQHHHKTSILTCSVCMKSYVSRHTFRKHLKSHYEKYDCTECGTSFNHKSLLINHIASIHNADVKNFSCNYCTRTFSSKASRNSHHQVAHKNKDNELIFKCRKCKVAFETKEDLRIHSFIHFNGDIKVCNICDQLFKTNRLLNVHLHKHTTEKTFQCEQCGQKFTYKSGLRKHHRLNRCKGEMEEPMDDGEMAEIALNQLLSMSVLDPKKANIRKREIIQVKKVEVEEIQPVVIIKKEKVKVKQRKAFLTCDLCNDSFKHHKEIVQHMREKHLNRKYNCPHCCETFKSRQKYLDHQKISHGIKERIAREIFSCEICDKKFDVKSILEAHKLSHFEIRSHACEKCGVSFKSVSNLKRHDRSVHTVSRDEICGLCNKAFKTLMSLKIHQKTVHVDMKVYVNCYYCSIIVLEKNLKTHIMNVHTEGGVPKNFICGVCQKSFKSESLLKRHYDSVHEPVDRGITYKCDTCDYSTTRMRDLKEHELNEHYVGTIHACECGSRFKSRRLLLTHMSTHNAAVNFPCSACVAAFKTRSGLRKHILKFHTHQENEEQLVEIVPLDS